MMTPSPSKVKVLLDLAARVLDRIDPRTVRVRDPRPRVGIWIGAATIGAALVMGAAALAASEQDDPDAAPEVRQANDEADERPPGEATTKETETAAPIARPEPAPKHARFHDPLYVFTDDPVARATAYPLADPPGLVVNLDGVPEPDRPPSELVGEDPRIRAVRRRVTNKGLRYIIGLEISIKRLQVVHEGNVVIITPIR
jgi:hypothetical protein